MQQMEGGGGWGWDKVGREGRRTLGVSEGRKIEHKKEVADRENEVRKQS